MGKHVALTPGPVMDLMIEQEVLKAKPCIGWVILNGSGKPIKRCAHEDGTCRPHDSPPPPFTRSLDASDFLVGLVRQQYGKKGYLKALWRVCKAQTSGRSLVGVMWNVVHATPYQRCLAALEVSGMKFELKAKP